MSAALFKEKKLETKTMDNIDNISLRAVKQCDMDAIVNLLKSISEFTPARFDYVDIWDAFRQQTNVYSIVAVIDTQIVGYGSVVIEKKIRGGKIGHIEDIVSHPFFRNKGIGSAIMFALLDVANTKGCYKVALQCKEHNVEFYEKCGYQVSGIAMQLLIK